MKSMCLALLLTGGTLFLAGTAEAGPSGGSRSGSNYGSSHNYRSSYGRGYGYGRYSTYGCPPYSCTPVCYPAPAYCPPPVCVAPECPPPVCVAPECPPPVCVAPAYCPPPVCVAPAYCPPPSCYTPSYGYGYGSCGSYGYNSRYRGSQQSYRTMQSVSGGRRR